MRFSYLALCSIFVIGCNGSAPLGTDGDDAGSGDQPDMTTIPAPPDLGPDLIDNGHVSNMYPAPVPAPPNVVTNSGPVLKAPKVVPVYFMNDDMNFTPQVTDFLNKVGATKYWAAVGTEYGVGPMTATMPVQLTENAPKSTSDAGIQTWLAGKLNANDPMWPAPDKNTLYALNYPTGTSITLQGSTSCQSFGGYHSNIVLDANHNKLKVAYLVVPRCDNFGGLTGIDAVTATESHELIEAATDPYPQTDPAYADVDDDHIYWSFALGGGEVGDMCAQFPDSFTKFAELDYVVQRSWSNKAINNGHDPCQPSQPDNEVYFAAVPEQNDQISILNGQLTLDGVQATLNQPVTIDVDLYSDADTNGPFNVKAADANAIFGGPSSFKFQLDRNNGQNGEKLHLTITPTKMPQYGAGVFVLIASIGQTQHYYFGIIGVQ
jgi:hypothetical protein